jgi:poly-gamma-glutamate capsule biosynthesis protein CapA/YwtB (metallophosphatase superfamily)
MAELTLFLAGDVMTGRGIDQVLPFRGDPALREELVRDARRYVALAEAANGPIPQPVDVSWPWGDVLTVLDEAEPDVRMFNVETSVTRSGDFAPGKRVHYRMHPDNAGCLAVARPDVCVLANNHVLDFGQSGLVETLWTLDDAGLGHTGAGRDVREAQRPAVVTLGRRRRVVVHAVGTESSGVPPSWAATTDHGGVAYVPDLSESEADVLLARVRRAERPGDVVVVSVHAGSNWGYDVGGRYARFARRLVDGGVDVVHGHSSHHPRPLELYRGRPILYGCGDLVNDYEGIGGYGSFRSELRLLYLVTLDADTHELARLRMVPVRARRLRLERVTGPDAVWLQRTVATISRRFGTVVELGPDDSLLARAADDRR